MKLTVLGSTMRSPAAAPGTQVLRLQEIAVRVRRGRILLDLFRYSEVRLLLAEMDLVSRPFEVALVLRLLARRACWFEDDAGQRKPITLGTLWRMLTRTGRLRLREAVAVPRIRRDVCSALAKYGRSGAPRPLDLAGTAVYIYSDIVPALRSGGSVGHVAGVLNNLRSFVGDVVLLESTAIPTVDPSIPRHRIAPEEYYHSYEHRALRFHHQLVAEARRRLNGVRVAFIYQRCSVFNFSGVVLARSLGVPLVLEFNGSEVWAQRNWGNPLNLEKLAQSIEDLNLCAADQVVVVSDPIRDDLVRLGVEPAKILVNPNGVDTDRYHPGVDGAPVRTRHGLDGKTVIGFIGTFGRWHGAEVLADAFGRLLNERPALRGSVRLLMIGDGLTMSEVRDAIARHGVGPYCVLTGQLPQSEGPAHLAACDVLASPHVPNADGTPFFGSPTKLFEYMAMGRAIVASDLGQIGAVLEPDRTAIMVEPGDVESLMAGLARAIGDADLRSRLGAAARARAVERHTWKRNTARVIEKLKELHPCP